MPNPKSAFRNPKSNPPKHYQMNLKDEILDRLDEAGYPENEFALHYDEFFTDIEDQEVIGVNIPYNKPTTQEFYQVLQLIAEYPEVDSIYVRIADADYPQDVWFSGESGKESGEEESYQSMVGLRLV